MLSFAVSSPGLIPPNNPPQKMKTTTPLGRIVGLRSAVAKTAFAAFIACSSLSSAATFLTSITLSNVTGNNGNLTGLTLDVYQVDSTTLLFKAINDTNNTAAIDLIYFSSLPSISSISFSAADSVGQVVFAPGGSPDHPPGTQSGNPLAANYFPTADLQFQSIASVNPAPPPPNLSSNVNRIDDNETGGFLVTMTGPIGDSLDLSEFRVAYHVQTIGSPQGEGGSDTYLGGGPDNIPVPEPTAATMAGLAGALMLLRRRRV